MNPFGHFDDDAREYVITRPDTPLPWINYLGLEEFFGIISNTAGGYCFYRDARLRRLTRYRYNNVPLDSNGRYIYIKDGNTIWNPSWKPTRTKLDNYECRHGLSYTQNTGETKKSIQLYGFVEFCLWDAQDDSTNFQRNFSTGQVEVERQAIFHVTE